MSNSQFPTSLPAQIPGRALRRRSRHEDAQHDAEHGGGERRVGQPVADVHLQLDRAKVPLLIGG